MKIQSELGATHTFRESEQILALFSNKSRQINNHDRVKQVVEKIGQELEDIDNDALETILVTPASELILNIDGGHLKTTEPDKRSIEAMTAVVYRPEALKSNKQETRNHITSKHCAASVKDDDQEQLISNTIIAALKQGLTDKTHITALCDGAENCWKVATALKPLAGSMTCILDWFHLSMKIQNIALTDTNKNKLIRIKWHLWRGNVDSACTRLAQLIDIVPEEHKDRLNKLLTYVKNNAKKIVDYRARKQQALVFTSNLAESTVESLINQRCKRQQHIQWSREGLDPILQLRAAMFSNDWSNKWRLAIVSALSRCDKSNKSASETQN